MPKPARTIFTKNVDGFRLLCTWKLQIKDFVHQRRLLRLQERNRYIVDGNSGCGMPFSLSVMRMSMNHKISTVPVDHLGQTGCSHERKDFRRLALHGFSNRRIVQHDHPLVGSQLRHPSLHLKRLIDRCPHEALDLSLAESRQHAPSKTADKSLSSTEPHSVPFVGASIQQFDPGGNDHAHKFFFFSALVVVITQYHNRW